MSRNKTSKEVMTMPERECPKCGAPMDHIADEPDVNIEGGWACTNEACSYFIHDEIGHGDDE
jgi:hypothetical protein